MTLFSYHKYNDFILIQEIYTQKYTACTKEEANRIADNNLQSDGTSYANGLAQADRCDCPEPKKTWSASISSGQFNSSYIPFNVTYNNPCGSIKTLTYSIYKMKDWAGETTYEFYKTGTVSIPMGSGVFGSKTESLAEIREGYVSGGGTFDC